MTLGEVQRVLQQLLREQVSIRDLGSLLEVMVEAAATNKNTVHLVETIRQSMGRTLMQPMLDGEGQMRVFVWIRRSKRKCWPPSKAKAHNACWETEVSRRATQPHSCAASLSHGNN